MARLCAWLSLSLMLAISWTGLASAQNKTILIGNLSGFTGAYSTIAQKQKEGIEMAMEEINQSGGMLGRKIEVIHEDTAMKPSMGTSKLERLILQNKVDFCIGALSSGVTLSAMKIAKKYNKILMVPISESERITGVDRNKQTFRVCTDTSMTSGGLAKYMVKNLGKNYYLLTVDYAWGRSVSERFHKNLKKLGANIMGEIYYPLGTKDFASYMGAIKAAKPRVLIITAAGNDAISVVNQIHGFGLSKLMKICGEGPLVTESLLPAMGSTADGIIAVDYYAATLNTPGNKAWVAKYKKLYGSLPTRHSLSSYTAVRWLAQAVKKAASVDSNKVIAALEGSRYTCPVREITVTMNPESHQALLPVYILEIVKGQRKVIAKQD